MFIETLEFTIPLDLCDLFNSLKRGPKANLEFPASVNSYGTTQDANIQVALKSNKLTFIVDGVSSNASIISKSECKTLKLSVFDVDCSLMSEQDRYDNNNMQYFTPVSNPVKRTRDRPMIVKSPTVKSKRTSLSESSPHSSVKSQDIVHHSPHRSHTKLEIDPINIKQEPDLIEIEPDSELYDDKLRDLQHLQTSKNAQSRLNPHAATSSPSFHENVPHVPDYAEPGPSHNQSADDYLVYQDAGDDDYGDNENSADFGNDDHGCSIGLNPFLWKEGKLRYKKKTSYKSELNIVHEDADMLVDSDFCTVETGRSGVECPHCGKVFSAYGSMLDHKAAIHDHVSYVCICGKTYKYKPGLRRHKQTCPLVAASKLAQVSDETVAN